MVIEQPQRGMPCLDIALERFKVGSLTLRRCFDFTRFPRAVSTRVFFSTVGNGCCSATGWFSVQIITSEDSLNGCESLRGVETDINLQMSRMLALALFLLEQ